MTERVAPSASRSPSTSLPRSVLNAGTCSSSPRRPELVSPTNSVIVTRRAQVSTASRKGYLWRVSRFGTAATDHERGGCDIGGDPASCDRRASAEPRRRRGQRDQQMCVDARRARNRRRDLMRVARGCGVARARPGGVAQTRQRREVGRPAHSRSDGARSPPPARMFRDDAHQRSRSGGGRRWCQASPARTPRRRAARWRRRSGDPQLQPVIRTGGSRTAGDRGRGGQVNGVVYDST